MGKYVAEQVVKFLIRKGRKVLGVKVLQLGITFKENCPDIRNSRAIDVVCGLQEFGCEIDIYNTWSDPSEIKREYGVKSTNKLKNIRPGDYDAIVLETAHRKFADLDVSKFRKGNAVVFDIKGVLPKHLVNGRL